MINTKIVAIVQARMGSTRLPRKVLKKINNTPMLKFQLDRIKSSKLLDEVVVATSTLTQDDEIYDFCLVNKIECFRGSEDDVLSRYFQCAVLYEAGIVVRITSDCPLIDSNIVDKVINLYKESGCDYAANTVPPETSDYPDGSDVEVFSMEALSKAYEEATTKEDREHVTFYFWKSAEEHRFRTSQLKNSENWSNYRFTVDYPEDLEVVKSIVTELNKRNQLGHLSEVIQVLKDHPDIFELNSKYYFGMGWEN